MTQCECEFLKATGGTSIRCAVKKAIKLSSPVKVIIENFIVKNNIMT